MDALIARTLGEYRLVSVLGRGGMSAVYLAERVDDPQALVAIKVLASPPLAGPDARAKAHARFVREIETATQLDHPHILRALAYGEAPATGDDAPVSYLVSPFAEGGSLAQYLAVGGAPLPLAECAQYITQVASALDYAHARGVIHRDVKPSNILLDAQGDALLADFGIARYVESALTPPGQPDHPTALTMTGETLGTPTYMAPEQIRGARVGPAADLYALGVVAYELVTGRPPFVGATPAEALIQHLQTAPPPPELARPDLPAPAEAAIMQALAKDPARRFASAGAFASAFADGLAGEWSADLDQHATQPSLTAQDRRIAALTPVTAPPTPPVYDPTRVAHYGDGGKDDANARTLASLVTLGAADRALVQAPTWGGPQRRQSRRGALPNWLVAALTLSVIVGLAILALAQLGGLGALARAAHLTSSATATATPAIGGFPPPLIPVGGLIYRVVAPGNCDTTDGAEWLQNASASQHCAGATLELIGPNCACPLGLARLQSIPGSLYPTAYVAQVVAQSVGPRPTDYFGLKFDQQAALNGGQGRGGYGYLLDRNGDWRFTRYDDDGARHILASGVYAGGAVGPHTLTLAVQGATFTFYVDGHRVASERDTTYSGGQIALAAEAGASVYFTDFALYAPPA
ncbi:MAG TPA: protein kinase [Ktedonobacterales bacterium]|nr:protein kinase [Ktedonobacterales bacterium]